MNIFILDNDPIQAARFHCDKHVLKMIVESCQLLSNAHHLIGDGGPYKITHRHHPCTKWVCKSHMNYIWLTFLLEGLLDEYTIRYGKVHKCTELIARLGMVPKNLLAISEIDITPFWSPKGYEYGNDKKYKTVVDAYRAYYINEKSSICTWKQPSVKPVWFKEKYGAVV